MPDAKLLHLDKDTRVLLDRYHFDAERFAAQQAQLRRTPFSPTHAHIQGNLRALEPDKYLTPSESLHRTRGEHAISRGEVAILLLNGGMATRFGGVAKGAAQALGERSFLSLRMSQAKALADALIGKLGCVLMNSFATESATDEHLKKNQGFGFARQDILSAAQGISVRLDEHGDIFRGTDGNASLYAPGHGDLPWALEVSGVAKTLKERGVKTLFVSNVDNLGCTLDATVLGAHLASGSALSVETIARDPKDVGGAPLYVDGKLQLVEGFRLPADFDHNIVTGFNTNSFYLNWDALDARVPLAFYPVAKCVDGKKAIQFERIVGELSAHVATTYLRVSRDPENGRFLPVKSPEDLSALQAILRLRYDRRRNIRR